MLWVEFEKKNICVSVRKTMFHRHGSRAPFKYNVFTNIICKMKTPVFHDKRKNIVPHA